MLTLRRKKFQLPKTETGFELNITSMADMFTILLVFLLQNFASSDLARPLPEAIDLPITQQDQSQSSDTVLQVNNRNEHFIASEKIVFSDLPSKLTKLAEQQASETLLLQADRSLSSDQLIKIMEVASQAGFKSIRLAAITGAH